MLAAGIIAPTRHSSWCSNLVVVREKNGSIIICIDFRIMNTSCLKDNYPLLDMKTLLQRVTGPWMTCMLNVCFGYNQVLVNKHDQHKNTFTTPWGTYKFLRMSFGLLKCHLPKSHGFCLQITYRKNNRKYHDDLTVFSKEIFYHISHLR